MKAPITAFDHVTVVSTSLGFGTAFMGNTLGVTLPPGGQHPKMGTHNALAQLAPEAFIEVIACDPTLPRPSGSRWFDLDALSASSNGAEQAFLATWVVRTTDIDASLAAARAAGLDIGRSMVMRRDNLTWKMSVRDDGKLPEGGTLPVLIEWPEGPHPSQQMANLGLAIEHVCLSHPQPRILAGWLDALNVDKLAQVNLSQAIEPGLSISISGPSGTCELSSAPKVLD